MPRGRSFSDNPYATYARIAALLFPAAPGAGRARVGSRGYRRRRADSAEVGPQAVIGARCRLGHGAVVGAGTVLGRDVTIGAETRLAPHVRFSTVSGSARGAYCIPGP